MAALLAIGCTSERTLPADAPTAAAPLPTAAAVVLKEQRQYAFPVRGKAQYGRAHHDYPAADIFARCGAAVVAPVSGIVVDVTRTDRWRGRVDSPRLRGGLSWTLVGDDGVRYYGSHLRRIERSVRPGTWVSAGRRLGQVGETGNAAGTGCHLHFGISPVCAAVSDWWVRRGALSPYPILRAWERGRNHAPVGAVDRWRMRHGCPRRPTGE